jgi:hypothetical protein
VLLTAQGDSAETNEMKGKSFWFAQNATFFFWGPRKAATDALMSAILDQKGVVRLNHLVMGTADRLCTFPYYCCGTL